MKLSKIITIGKVLFFVTSCATSIKFPVSNLAPAAEISAVKKKDSHNNYDIKVTAKHLASPSRLDSSKNVYVVWVLTEHNGTQNIGQLIHKNAQKVVLKTTTPFIVKEIFITAEDQGSATYPTGVEITRKKW